MNSVKNKEQDQAEELRQLIEQTDSSSENQISDENERDVDILNLPPRKEVHGLKKSRTHLKLSSPVLRLLFVFIAVLGIIAGTLFYLFENNTLGFATFLSL